MSRTLRYIVILATPFLLASCAAGLTPLKESMPVARASLQPEYRLFYDALIEHGDWVLIEPYGYLFRPRVNFVAWRPYEEGFWVPTDVYGWVWVSAEPFGWATYHYGQWFYDRFQGWVWLPGIDWAPAWVAWEANDSYVGWAPLMAGGSDASIPGGAFRYVPASEMTATNLKTRIVSQEELGERVNGAKSITNFAERNGVRFNRGPRIDWVERHAGPLQRTRVLDLVDPVGAGAMSAKPTAEEGKQEDSTDEITTATRRAAIEAAREARKIVESEGAAPSRLPVVRPIGAPEKSDAKTREPRRKTAKNRNP